MPDYRGLVDEFVAKLNKRKVEGSQATARLTAELLRSVVSLQKLPCKNQASVLIESVRSVGVQLIAANPIELAVGNIVRRVLHIIREEDVSILTSNTGDLNLSTESADEEIEQDNNPSSSATAIADIYRSSLCVPSLHALLEDAPSTKAPCRIYTSGLDSEEKYDKYSLSRKLKHFVIEAIKTLIGDIDSCHDQIAQEAVEHIHQNEVILTFGRSRTVLKFLHAAKEKKRSFKVFIAEGAPRCQGHVLAKELAGQGLKSTVIGDAAVFAIIARVNLVIVGVHAVMANGGVIAPIGMHMVALAAHKHAIPFVVVAGIHKLCPLYLHNQEVSLNEMRSPSELLEFGKFSNFMDYSTGVGVPPLHVANPAFDYVPPELVSLLITDVGGYKPSYMYRLIADYYCADDFVLPEKHDS